MMCSLSMSVSANSVIDYVEPGIELMYLYTDNVSTSVYRSGSNIAYKCDAKGKSTATKISIYLYLQELFSAPQVSSVRSTGIFKRCLE